MMVYLSAYSEGKGIKVDLELLVRRGAYLIISVASGEPCLYSVLSLACVLLGISAWYSTRLIFTFFGCQKHLFHLRNYKPHFWNMVVKVLERKWWIQGPTSIISNVSTDSGALDPNRVSLRYEILHSYVSVGLFYTYLLSQLISVLTWCNFPDIFKTQGSVNKCF